MEVSPKILVIIVGFLTWVLYIYTISWLRPEKIRKRLRGQGITGPPPSFFFGNVREMKKIDTTAAKTQGDRDHKGMHDYLSSIFPYFECWRKSYGPVFQYTIGSMPVLFVSEPNIGKEMLQCSSLDVGRPSYLKKNAGALVGQSIISLNGETWMQQRKVIAPEFFAEKVKGMVDLMIESLDPLLASWEDRVDAEGGSADIRVDLDLKKFSADVISRACFGSSHIMGKEVFLKFRDLQEALARRGLAHGFRGLRYLPTKTNRVIWRLDKEVKASISEMIKKRCSMSMGEKDLLQAMLNSVKDGRIPVQAAQNFIVDNCKGLYFAGHETTSTTLAWTMMLLAIYPEWQTRIREEVEEVCSGKKLNSDKLSKMKVLTMVLQESMRLYPVTPFVQREALQGIRLGNLELPKGANLWIASVFLHRDTELWGPDAGEFKPERFANGIAYACNVSQVYVPFGNGPRVCIGQFFAMMEMKILLSLMLSRFSLSLSPTYRHSVSFRLVLEPENGVSLILKKV